MKDWLKQHRGLVIAFLLLIAFTLAWAASELSGQANKTSADAGANSADMEMASLDSLEAPKDEKKATKQEAPNCDWSLEKSLRKQIESNDAAYRPLVDKAQGERNSAGVVSSGTKDQVMASANEFKGLNDEYATMWYACNCKTRGDVATDAGNSRISSAEVLLADEVDDNKVSAMEGNQAKLRDSRGMYAEQASSNDELSKASKTRIKQSLMPRAKKLVLDATDYLDRVTYLLQQVQSTAQSVSSGNAGAVAGCAAQAASGDFALLTSVKTLLSLAETMLSNANSLVRDITLLAD